jgi:hypothetical protein
MCKKMAEVRQKCDAKSISERCLYAKSQMQEHWALWSNKTDRHIEDSVAEGKKNGQTAKYAHNILVLYYIYASNII